MLESPLPVKIVNVFSEFSVKMLAHLLEVSKLCRFKIAAIS